MMNEDEVYDIDVDEDAAPIEIVVPKKAFLKCYHHLLGSDADINLLWGGRDSGKSYFVAQRLIMDCLTLPYFRCMLIKKTYNSIRESQYQILKDIIYRWGFESFFTFSSSPIRIVCKNGNTFIGRGCDDPQKIKSTANPSHAWYEEGNQLTLEDFVTVSTTLRSNEVPIQQWFSFNPECDGNFEDFWVWKTFFDVPGIDIYQPNFTHIWEMKLPDNRTVKYRYTSTHTTYKTNDHVSIERVAMLEQLQNISPYYYDVFTLGRWGRKQNNSPFAYAFDRKKHVGDVAFVPSREVYLSFDFNKSPICAGVYQCTAGSIHCVESIKLASSDIYAICDYIKMRYPNSVFLVTGDSTGRATSALVRDSLNYYTVIKAKLNLSNAQIKVPAMNPPLEENQMLVNACLIKLDVKIDRTLGKPLIYDMENVRMLPDGGIDKSDRTNPAMQADSLDHFRYLCNTFYRHILKQ